MDMLYSFAAFVVGWLLGYAIAKMAGRPKRFPSGSIPSLYEGRHAPDPPYAVTDGERGNTLLRTDDLQLAKDFRAEARDAGLPARLVINGKDRG